MLALTSVGYSYGATATVLGTDQIYAAGGNSGLTVGATTPGTIALGGATSVTFTSATGIVCLNFGTACGDPTGTNTTPPIVTSSNLGAGFFSGIPSITNKAGYLTGVFYTTPTLSTSAGVTVGTSIPSGTSPAMNTVFIIGAGPVTFNVPARRKRDGPWHQRRLLIQRRTWLLQR